MYVIAWNLEKIADEYKDICKYLEEKKQIEPQLIILFEKVNQYFKGYYELFYTFKLEELERLEEIKKELQQEITRVFPSDPKLTHHLANVTSKTTDFSASMIALHHEKLLA